VNHIVFRTDSSIDIGAGHVMRCLTLAGALRDREVRSSFLCREREGHLGGLIQDKGYPVRLVQDENKESIISALKQLEADTGAAVTGLMVDHYELDAEWERPFYEHLPFVGVIDDLNDRPHFCHFLLDQTFGKEATAYRELVPEGGTVYAGSRYALLRPEFAALRESSLNRRADLKKVRHILVTLGGMDRDNVTLVVLKALEKIPLPETHEVTVVMGASAPHRDMLAAYLERSALKARLRVGVENMAELMAMADFCIGATGSTAWERCCLGLPTLQLVVAENQKTASENLARFGAAINGGEAATLTVAGLAEKLRPLLRDMSGLHRISATAARVCDGRGAERAAQKIREFLP
tara:strand:- start:4487 stop:5542 length:1056 start_codon:yes stop_codon:yes gene_type:complete